MRGKAAKILRRVSEHVQKEWQRQHPSNKYRMENGTLWCAGTRERYLILKKRWVEIPSAHKPK